VLVEGETYDAEVTRPVVEKSYVSPGYFKAIGTPLLTGRVPAPANSKDTRFEVVVNEAFAERYWPASQAIGRLVRSNSREETWSGVVVGVVGDLRQWGLERVPLPEIYYPVDVTSRNTRHLVIRALVPPLTLTRSVRTAVASLDRDQPVASIRTMGDVFSNSASGRRFQTALVQLFVLSALVMVLAGVYGVASYFVTERVREIGIRVALGAGRADVIRLVAGWGVAPALLGATIGAGLALAGSRLTAGMLYGVSPRDPLALVSVALLVAAVASLGAALPALRATRLDPARAINSD
jgi:putative ABC transport system permease protein